MDPVTEGKYQYPNSCWGGAAGRVAAPWWRGDSGGRPATTHWASLDLLAELDPTIEVRGDDRFVDDGDVVTSAGVSAGIDMALYVLARLGGRERAKKIRRYIQYDPLPPV